MSTRKLILTALVCGLAIVLAGGIKLFQVASDTTRVTVLTLGDTAELGDMTVSVESIEQASGGTNVTVTMSGVDGADAREGWRMLADGQVKEPVKEQSSGTASAPGGTMSCDVTTVEPSGQCVLQFPASTGTVTIAYLRAGQQSQWSNAG